MPKFTLVPSRRFEDDFRELPKRVQGQVLSTRRSPAKRRLQIAALIQYPLPQEERRKRISTSRTLDPASPIGVFSVCATRLPGMASVEPAGAHYS